MPRIVNLSACQDLDATSNVMNRFVAIGEKYSESIFSACCNPFRRHITPLTNYGWVAWKHKFTILPEIDQYKLGNRTTEQFLDKLLEVFYFLDDSDFSIQKDDQERLDAQHLTLVSLSKVEGGPTQRDYARALLEEAWNSLIRFSDNGLGGLAKLFEESSPTNPLYFISNSNHLNIHQTIVLLIQLYPTLDWSPTVFEDIKTGGDNGVVKIASNCYMCLSYTVGAFKTETEMVEQNLGTTPSLLKHLVTSLALDLSTTEVISQYPKDLVEARRLGVDEINCIQAEKFMPANLPVAQQHKAVKGM